MLKVCHLKQAECGVFIYLANAPFKNVYIVLIYARRSHAAVVCPAYLRLRCMLGYRVSDEHHPDTAALFVHIKISGVLIFNRNYVFLQIFHILYLHFHKISHNTEPLFRTFDPLGGM